MSLRFTTMLSSRNFIILTFTLNSLMYWVIFTYGVRSRCNFIYLHLAVDFHRPFVEKILHFTMNCLVNLTKNQFLANVKFNFWIINLIPLNYMYLLMPLSQSHDCCFFTVTLDIRTNELSKFSHFQDYVGFSGSLSFRMNFRIS
jgi:hypothetical protein